MIHAVANSAGNIPSDENAEPKFSSVTKSAGGSLPIRYDPANFKPRYGDEYTGETLPPELIRAAIIEELDYFNDRVWEVSTIDEMKKVPGHIFVRSRWVNCNKGDAASPDVRARLVACEINRGDKQDHFFASTPPLEAKKMLFARFAQERNRDGQPLRLSFVDVRKAYFNGKPKRPLYMSFPKELGLPSNLVAKQVRCVYGTRDAGAIWEDTYRAALEDMGFISGAGSPCCFWHEAKNISVVVHGDDFTAMGLNDDLDWYEKTLAENFELKIRGRLGEGCTGPQQIRILNRIVTLNASGLQYEADPRHVDLLVKSMGLQTSNAVATPGQKDPEPDYDAEKNDDADSFPLDVEHEADNKINSLKKKKDDQKVKFTEPPEVHSVPAYSTIYGVHPRFIASTADGFQSVSSHADPFTSKNGMIMRSRYAKLYLPERQLAAHQYRSKFIRSINQDVIERAKIIALLKRQATADASDPSFETVMTLAKSIICANRTPPAQKNKYAAKRQGAKAVKKMEQISDAYLLSSEDATMFRALSARANYLAQDRPDIGYSTKELCREFARPNRNSYQRLKRVCRYLAGKPRLVHHYPWGNGVTDEDNLEIFVDTDFAGCKETRRSTAGGVCLINGSLVKAWSKTQTTIALSSGEAELGGISSGIAQGLGMQSVARDLGFRYKLRVHSDATAAIGICRRRGMGKIRHLDVSDLWCQEKIRTGAVTLVKVLGTENMADIMTKYVDRPILSKMLDKLNLSMIEGRAECAPAVV